MKTIILPTEMSFQEALAAMMRGECLGIRPGENSGYVEFFKPHWMSENSPDSFLHWRGTDGDTGIRADQFAGPWRLVIVDHRDLPKEKTKEKSS